tara:strand:+ start:1356 stop:2366 length:1011 start_codon:yes stop_codon:yes gene_type:complete
MSEQTNPETGVDSGPLTVSEAAERFGSLLGHNATEEQTDEATEVEAEAETEEATPETDDEPEGESDESDAETEESETEEVEDDQPAPKRWKVKASGEELEVTEDELVKGYQRDSDYRKKTSEIAEKSRAIEAERQHNEQVLNDLVPLLQAQLQDKFAGVNWQELARDDPSTYVALRAEYEGHVGVVNYAHAEQKRIADANRGQAEIEHKQRLATEYKRMVERIPGIADPVKGKEIRGGIKTYLEGVGYSGEEIAGLADSRAAEIAYKAMLYDKALVAKSASAEKVKKLPKVQKSGTAQRNDSKATALGAAKDRLRKSGSVSDAARLFEIAGIGNSN